MPLIPDRVISAHDPDTAAQHAAADAPDAVRAVCLRVPARLHLGFLDLEGGLGRRFGSLGLTLDQPALEADFVHGAGGGDGGRLGEMLARLDQALGTTAPIAVRVHQAIPAHAGLGSGTQTALAAGCAHALLNGRPFDPVEVAHLLDRGARSGIGIGAFGQGGVLLDGGRNADERPAPIIARHDFPASWRILLLLDGQREGLHGVGERQAFQALPPFPASLAGHLCRLVVMQALPALVERDLSGFGRAVTALQNAMGDHFADAQGGGRYASPEVAAALGRLAARGVEGYGQSSWGPTGFAFARDAAEAEDHAAALRAEFDDRLEVRVVAGRNTGAARTVR